MGNNKTNIVYFLLDSENNPTEFAAIDTDSSEFMDPTNLDPQTLLLRQTVFDNSGSWGTHSVSAGVVASLMSTSSTVYDNSSSWSTGTASADEYGAAHDTVQAYSGTWQKITGVIDNVGPVSANIATNTAAIGVLDDDVDVLGAVSANIATNTAAIGVLDDDVNVVGAVSATIATNTGLVGGVIDNLSPVSANIGSTASADEYGAAHDSVASWSGFDPYGGAGWMGAWYRVFSTSAGWNSTKSTVDAKEDDWDYAANTAASGVTHGYGALSGSMQLTRGSGALSAVAVSSAGERTLDYSVPSFDHGANKIAWRRPALVRTGTAIVIPGGDNNLSFNLTSGGKSNLIASGITAKSVETDSFISTNSELNLGLGSLTVSAYALEVATALSAISVSATDVSAVSLVVEAVGAAAMPIPAPYGYVHFTTAGTAQDTIQNIGIGCSKYENISSADDFVWDDTNKRFDIVNTGTYEFTLNAVLMVAATTTITLQLYNTYPGTSVLTADTRVHSSIDADIVTLTYVGPFVGGNYAYATTTDDGGTDVTIYPGTTLTIKRLK